MPVRVAGEDDDDLTAFLGRWREGAPTADDELMRKVGPELRRLALSYLRRERPGHTFQPTDLVHEAYLRLLPQRRIDWKSRSHFFGIAARMMRRILVDYARRGRAQKRNHSGAQSVSVSLVPARSGRDPVDVLDLDRALRELGELDARQEVIVELRAFGGLTIPEIADVMGLAESTIKKEWTTGVLFVRHWLTGG